MTGMTLLLNTAASGRCGAEELLPLVYDELRRLAAIRMTAEASGQTLQPTALVHEAWLKLCKDGNRTWRNRTHFFRAAAQAMRRILVDRARDKQALKRSGEKIAIHDIDLPMTCVEDRVLLVEEALQQLEQNDPESARLITLKFFGGLTNREIAAMEGASERTVERHWVYAKAALYDLIQAAN